MTTEDVATPLETVAMLLDGSNRIENGTPLRHTFLQQGTRAEPAPGPLAQLVRNGDRRGLDLYLLLKAVASAGDFSSHRGADVWARALRHTGVTATAQTVTKIWPRLERLGLIRRSKHGRLADIVLLREDGHRDPYTHPANDKRPNYLQLTSKYWINSDEQWCSTLSLPAKAMLLIALSLGNEFVLPVEKAPAWYGISADTAQRGIAELSRRGVLTSHNVKKKAPLAPKGFTYDRRFTLVGDFGHTWISTP
jgi:hypothetical protein